jgi:hypothetical protein
MSSQSVDIPDMWDAVGPGRAADDKEGIEYYLKKLAVLSGFLPVFGYPSTNQEIEKTFADMRANIPADKEVQLAEFDTSVVAHFETTRGIAVRQSEGRYEYAVVLTCPNYSEYLGLDRASRLRSGLVESVLGGSRKSMRVEWVRVADAPHYVEVEGYTNETLHAVKNMELFGVCP